jgi:hypothetical protein
MLILAVLPPSHLSRNPSYYAAYPVATPSTLNGSPPDTSPAVRPADDSSMIGALPMATSDSFGSNGERPQSMMARRMPSVDRLRTGASPAVTGPMGVANRPSSPSSAHFPNPYPASHRIAEDTMSPGSATPPSPPYPHSSSRSSSPMLSYPRPSSMSSLSSRGYNYLHVGPARGAPHQGRPIQLEMPRILSGDISDRQSNPRSPGGGWEGQRSSGSMPVQGEQAFCLNVTLLIG